MIGEGISLGELTATIKRQEIIMNNVEDPEERFVAFNILRNLKQIDQQQREFIKHPIFAEAVKQFTEQENTECPKS